MIPPRRNRPRTAAVPALTLFLSACAAAALLVLATSGIVGAAPARTGAPECAAGVDFLGFSDALNKRTYEGTSVGGLSALAYDGRRGGLYYSLVDNGPAPTSEARFYTLGLPTRGGALGTPEILDVTTLRDASGRAFTASDLDGEGLALARDGDLLASSETEPSIRRFSSGGELLEELPVPQKFRVAPEGQAQRNQTFESLALSPNGRSLFTAVEGPLVPDGRTAEGEAHLRILRYEDRGPGGFAPAGELYYLADPGLGVVETVALSEDDLLVLERGFQSGAGNTVRVYRVSLDGAEDVTDEPSLAAPGLEPLEKELLVDLADCPSSGATTPGTQPNPLLDNFESLALGPRLPGGRQSLLLQSDDNFSAGQVTRVVALGVEGERLRTVGR
ncbi:esterase-like activity of phytase family protein [Rubrobacter marinus]|uniref:Esterase-like activity of phytase family protein n=1 Tax=Rubrobacter marinus TaxID=2653852 RepID=A0A6G8PUI4_9ACTN|nr:esterase-like activity of phytase family protein [Rubrobacter marinus]QIN77812.1 esterase-like activity of phytase family protein [Rubrobacter marinus]